MKEYVAGFLFTPNDEVVVVQKKRPAWQDGLYNAVGGKIETGEAPYDAMVREFREETGKTVLKWNKFATLSNTNGNYIVHFYMSRGTVEDITHNLTDEPIFVLPSNWLTVRNSVRNVPWLVRMAEDFGDLSFGSNEVVHDIVENGAYCGNE